MTLHQIRMRIENDDVTGLTPGREEVTLIFGAQRSEITIDEITLRRMLAVLEADRKKE